MSLIRILFAAAVCGRKCRLQHETGDVPANAFALGSVLGCQPAHITKIADSRVLPEDRLHEHQYPLIDRIDQHNALSLLPFCDCLTHPCRRPFFLALVDDGSEGRIYVVRFAP